MGLGRAHRLSAGVSQLRRCDLLYQQYRMPEWRRHRVRYPGDSEADVGALLYVLTTARASAVAVHAFTLHGCIVYIFVSFSPHYRLHKDFWLFSALLQTKK